MYELPTYFILPLCGVNFKDFGRLVRNEWNFKDCKVNVEEKLVRCEVFNTDLVPNRLLETGSFLRLDEANKYYYFQIPETIRITLDQFVEGRYSEIPNPIKRFLEQYSGLHSDHEYFQALHKDSRLRQQLQEDLEVLIEEDAELLDPPKAEWFY